MRDAAIPPLFPGRAAEEMSGKHPGDRAKSSALLEADISPALAVDRNSRLPCDFLSSSCALLRAPLRCSVRCISGYHLLFRCLPLLPPLRLPEERQRVVINDLAD